MIRSENAFAFDLMAFYPGTMLLSIAEAARKIRFVKNSLKSCILWGSVCAIYRISDFFLVRIDAYLVPC